MTSDVSSLPLFGGIEGGGTKFVCAIGTSPEIVLDSITLPTSAPATTLAECVDWFRSAERKHGSIAGFGIASFGPIELAPDSPDFGRMMQTPKAGWSGASVVEPLRAAFAVPIAVDTDVAAAALAELHYGAGRGAGSLAYVTVGTGIGGAVAPQDGTARRLMHAEMGHLQVRRDPRDSGFAGTCRFHRDCLEGLASGPAILSRWGCTLDRLPPEHAGPAIIGGYLGQLAGSITLMTQVERIVFGGGVMADGKLLPIIRSATFDYLNGYIAPLNDSARAARYICGPALGANAGIAGALLLAQQAYTLDSTGPRAGSLQ